MIIVAQDRQSDASIAGIPDAITVKICTHPAQLMPNSKAKIETLHANRAGANIQTRKAITKANDLAANSIGGSNYVYYVELDTEGEKIAARITTISGDNIDPIMAEVRRGKFFAGKSECSIVLNGFKSSSPESFERVMEVMEIARFICYDIH